MQHTTLIAVQSEYGERLNAARLRWGHCKGTAYQVCGGHYNRIARKAGYDAERQLRRLGYSDPRQIAQVLKDARDMAELEWRAGVLAGLYRSGD
jgi:hypothetical protein